MYQMTAYNTIIIFEYDTSLHRRELMDTSEAAILLNNPQTTRQAAI